MKNKFKQFVYSLILGLGEVFLFSPLLFYWFVQGDFNRYLWIINGPFPFNNFGSGLVQMFIELGLFSIGVILLIIYFVASKRFRKIIMEQSARRKKVAVDFLNTVIAGHIREAFAKHVGKNFRHHNPFFKGDRESLILAMEENELKFPNKSFETKKVLEDGDIIAVHSCLLLKSDMSEMIVIHIFRFVGDQIVEMWDIGQPSIENSPNENGMF